MSRGDRRDLVRDRVGLLFERGVPALAAGWLLFLLVPLSSTGLAFPLRARPHRSLGHAVAPEARFISDGCGVLDECDLIDMPGPIPAGRSKTRVKHLERAWYHLYSVF